MLKISSIIVAVPQFKTTLRLVHQPELPRGFDARCRDVVSFHSRRRLTIMYRLRFHSPAAKLISFGIVYRY